ncbi:peptidase, partial [Streptomyces globisporus]
AVVDGPLVSSRAWPDHAAWMREFLRVLRSSPSGTPSSPSGTPSSPSGA